MEMKQVIIVLLCFGYNCFFFEGGGAICRTHSHLIERPVRTQAENAEMKLTIVFFFEGFLSIG